jgi:hypothetical protein
LIVLRCVLVSEVLDERLEGGQHSKESVREVPERTARHALPAEMQKHPVDDLGVERVPFVPLIIGRNPRLKTVEEVGRLYVIGVASASGPADEKGRDEAQVSHATFEDCVLLRGPLASVPQRGDCQRSFLELAGDLLGCAFELFWLSGRHTPQGTEWRSSSNGVILR